MAAALLALHAALAAHPESAWDERVDPACCPYPEHDPRDYNWPYSHFQYSEVIPDVTGSFVPMTELNISFPSGVVADYGKPIPPSLLDRIPEVAIHLALTLGLALTLALTLALALILTLTSTPTLSRCLRSRPWTQTRVPTR